MNNSVEKYIIIEIFEKLIRLKNFMNSNKDSIKESGMKISLNVFEEAFEKALIQLELPILLVSKEDISESERISINRRLSNTLNLVREFHTLLKFIHSEWVRPETYTFSNRILKNLPDELKKTRINVILIDDYSFKENNLTNKFNEIFKRSKLSIDQSAIEYPTLFLPKIEMTNPLNWSILAHEIGHINTIETQKLIGESIIPPNTTVKNKEILLKWAEEIFCDIFAINILGPAYFASFVSYSIVTGGLVGNNICSEIHPSNMMRIRFLYEYLERNGFKLEYTRDSGERIDICDYFYNLSEDVDKINRIDLKSPNDKRIEIPNLTYFLDEIREISRKFTSQMKFQSNNQINELLKKLLLGIPIGSICEATKAEIEVKLQEKTKDSFERAKKLISHRSTTLWEILNTGWIYKVVHVIPTCSKLIFDAKHDSLYDKLNEVSGLFDLLDDRLLKSIESSEIHNLIETN
ncbi:MAG: hypothetical protein ABI462_04580 [Ignavibacteria bacterium]